MISDAQTLAMVEDLVGRANLAMMRCLNKAIEQVAVESQKQVPKGDPTGHEQRAAKESGKYPVETLEKSMRVEYAAPHDLTAQVIYESPYAAAQEAGVMPFVGPEGTIMWNKAEWQAENYTSSGTKAHYLEDPGKMVLAQIPEELAIQGHLAMEGK